MMLHHIKKSSSTLLKTSPLEILHQLRKKQVNLYPKNNNKVVKVMDQTRFLDEESSKKPAAAAAAETLLDQISLRPFELTDVDDIMVWATDKQLSRYYGGEWGRYRSKEEAVKDLKDHIITDPWFKAICLKNRPIGKIAVERPYANNPHAAGLAYVIAPKHWGKGIATTAVKMVLNTVFKEKPRLERLEATVDAKNLGSLRVLEKSGFLKEGVLRKYYLHKGRSVDIAMFSFLNTDFKLG